VTISGAQAAAAQRALEAGYGLALEGLAAEQIRAAVAAAWTDEDDPADPHFLERVVDRLPIEESWLFREDEFWKWVDETAGPEILETASAAARRARILSIGCSAGQEPFSAAILFQRLLERAGIGASVASAFVQIVGVDSSPARIEAARSGLLSSWSVQRCRPEWLAGRVTAEHDLLGRHRVTDSVRAMCHFEVGNLLDLLSGGNAALGGFDLVLCRNVLIYFRKAMAEHAAERLGRSVDPGAVLVFSSAEAHLLASSGAKPSGYIAAGRPATRPAPPRRRARAQRSRTPSAGNSRTNGAGDRVRAPRLAQQAPATSAAQPGDAIASHIRVSLEHAEAGRVVDALREARAALFHDPRHLYSRLLVGKHLIGVDDRRGREVLRDLLESAQWLPADAAVPCADGLSVGQLAAAVRLMLDDRRAP
jgi:chemotaxis methyl-accepting protein methylase